MPVLAAFAERLAAKRAAARLQQAARADSGGSAIAAKFKRVQFVLDVVKVISLTVSLFTGGLDGFSIGTFLVVANGELLASLFVPWFKQQQWRKIVIITLDILIVSLGTLIIGTIAYIHTYPDEACKAFGGAWSKAAGEVGACSVLKDVFDQILLK